MMNNLRYFKIISSIFIVFGFAQRVDSSEIKLPRLVGPIKIDGYLNEEDWEKTAKIDQFYISSPESEHGKRPKVKTEVLMGYDDRNLYIGFIGYENEISKIKTTKVGRGESWKILKDDNFCINLNTYPNLEESYYFWVNSCGVQYDIYYKNNLTKEIDIIWYADGKILDSCWTVEVAIPFTSIRFPDGNIQKWRVLFSRFHPREKDFYYSHQLIPRGMVSVYPYMARLYINERIKLTQKKEFLPYFVGGTNKEKEKKIDFIKRIGIGGKYYFTYNHVLDWAILPDYSQVESDAPQIDVNTTFALYYPEKRPFFLERKAFFETPLEIFYSRTINDPVGALKFAGGIKNTNFGYIGAFDRHTLWVIPFAERSFSITSDKKSFTNVFRVKQSILKSSYFGFLTTNRDLGNGFNRLFNFDGYFSFLKHYSLNYQGLISWTKEPDDSTIFKGYPFLKFGKYTSRFDGDEFIGKGFYLDLRHQSKYLFINGYYKGLSPEFRADNGFIQSNDFELRGFSTAFIFWPRRFYLGYISPRLGINEKRRFFKERYELEKSAYLTIQFQRQIFVIFGYKLLSKEYQGAYFDRIWSFNNSISAAPIKYFNFSIFWNYGREINYRAIPPTLGLFSSPSFNLRLTFGKLGIEFYYNKYLFWQDGFYKRIYDTEILGQRITWSFTRHLNLRLLSQSSLSSKEIFLSPLLSFEPTALTILYFGSNHILKKPLGANNFEMTDTKVFLKFQYQFKF